MRKVTSKMSYLFIVLFTLVTLSGCKVYDKDKNALPIDGGLWDTVFVNPVALLIKFMTENTGSFASGVILATIVVRTI